ncbi:MAG: hypothetical protein JWO30_1301 [Fibrobacteres bacterium]|nr:hypothetical protein [Fibrobacterota bacterium]
MSNRDARPGALVLPALFVLYFCLGLSGYGNDNDTYGMLKTWSDLFRHGVYSPSRPPGYPLPEIAIGAAAQAGGWAASNALSALFACGCLACGGRLVRIAFGPRAALLSMAAVGLNPYFVIAASSSMDYVYAAFFFLAGILALVSGRSLISGALFALCVASRLTYAPLIVLAYAAASVVPARWPRLRASADLRKLAGALLLFLFLGSIFYLPSWISMGPAMFRPTLSDNPVSLVGIDGFPTLAAYAVRFVYKNVSLWGLPAFLVLAIAAGAAWVLRRRPVASADSAKPRAPIHPILWAVAAGILYAEALFFRLPLEIPYLLPVLFLGVFLINFAPRAASFLVLVAACQALQGVAQVDFIEKIYARKSYESVEASGGRVRLHIGRGVVWEDLATRKDAQAHYFRSILGDSAVAQSGR